MDMQAIIKEAEERYQTMPGDGPLHALHNEYALQRRQGFEACGKWMLQKQGAFEDFFSRYKEWSHATFGIDPPIHGITKLKEETKELEVAPYDIKEYVDCIQCILYAFSCAFPDKTISDLVDALNEKLAINEKREWIKQPDGTFKHKKEVENV